MGLKKLIHNYRTLGPKEFGRRFKEGVEAASPLSQTSAQMTFTKITMFGIALGFGVAIFYAKNLWWLAIILGAALGNTYVSYIALKQKYKLLKKLEEVDEALPVENKEEEVKND